MLLNQLPPSSCEQVTQFGTSETICVVITVPWSLEPTGCPQLALNGSERPNRALPPGDHGCSQREAGASAACHAPLLQNGKPYEKVPSSSTAPKRLKKSQIWMSEMINNRSHMNPVKTAGLKR